MTTADTDWLIRTRYLLGDEAMTRLASARVAVIGLGGVGGMAVEALARAGIGSLMVVDVDAFSMTNINRQTLAARSTLGKPKAEVARQRILDINPECTVEAREAFYNIDSAPGFLAPYPDVVVDAIDGMNPKTLLLAECLIHDIPVVSAAGAGRRLDPTKVEVTNLSEVTGDRLAARVRKRLRRRGLDEQLGRICVVHSTEEPRGGLFREEEDDTVFDGRGRKRIPVGSFSTVPAAVGLAAAYAAIGMILEG